MEGWSADLCDGQQGEEGRGIREDYRMKTSPRPFSGHRIGAIICHELNVARLEVRSSRLIDLLCGSWTVGCRRDASIGEGVRLFFQPSFPLLSQLGRNRARVFVII